MANHASDGSHGITHRTILKVAGKVTQDYIKLEESEIIYLECLYSIHRVKNNIQGGLKNMKDQLLHSISIQGVNWILVN